MKKIISKRIDIREKRNKEIGEAIKMKKGAKDLGRILKIKQTGNRDLTHISKEISTFDDSTPKDQLMEVSVKTMGVGEFFGHDDLLNDRQRYTATFKCVSLTAMIYVITKKVYIYIYIIRILISGLGIYQVQRLIFNMRYLLMK